MNCARVATAPAPARVAAQSWAASVTETWKSRPRTLTSNTTRDWVSVTFSRGTVRLVAAMTISGLWSFRIVRPQGHPQPRRRHTHTAEWGERSGGRKFRTPRTDGVL